MNREVLPKNSTTNKPLYVFFWEKLKLFPKGLAQGSSHPPIGSGPAAAALISAGIGSVLMMISHHLADTSKERENLLWSLGSWIPGSHNPDKMWGNIGSFSGKETVLLIGWLVSWSILHILWRDRQIKARTILFWFITLFVIATTMIWHPLFPYLTLGE